MGIGTNTPSARLHVVGPGSGNAGQLYIADDSAYNGSPMGVIQLGGQYRSSPTDTTAFAEIYGAKENGVDGDYAGYLSFYTRTNGSIPAERLRVSSAGAIRFNNYNCSTFVNGGVLTTDASGNIICADDDGGAGGASTLQATYDADVDGSDAIITLTAADGGILFRDASTALGTTLFAVQDNTGATGYLTVSAATTAIGNNLTVTGSGTFNGNVTVGDASSDTLTVAATSTFNAAVTVNATQTVNTDSGSAFRINNSTSGEVLNVDTTNSQVTINGQNQEDIRNWAGTTAIPWARQDAASAVYNGYVYSTGGAAGVSSTPDTNMSKAKINPDGSLGSWTSVGMLAARQEHVAVAYQGYLYIISGNANTALSPDYQNNVWVAKINPDDGGVGAGMRGLTALPTGLRLARGLAYNGYIYVVGGNNGATVSTVYYAKVLSDGSLGTWNTATAGLPLARQSHDVVVANGRMYVIGGYNGSAQSSVYFGTIGSDGNITSWTTATNPLPEARSDHASFVQNGYIYVTGGGSSGATNTVYYSKINSSTGQPGTWATSTVLPATRLGHNVETYNGYVYLMGGSYTTNVYYGSGPRTKVAGTLDLTTVGGSDIMSANGMAGVLSAGDTNVLGDLRVTQSSLFLGDANFANDVVIDSPDAQLMVVNKISGGEVLPLKLHNDTSTTGSKVAIDFGVSQVYNTTTAKIGVERMDGGAGDIYFNNYNGSALIETVRIQSDGDLAVDTNTLFVDAVNDRVGIGTAAPEFKLQIAGAGNNFVSNDAYAGIGVFQGRRANGTQAAPTALATNEVITQLSARGHDGTAFSGTQAAITLQTIGAWNGTSHGTAIRFQVTDSSSTTLVQQAGLNSDGSFVIANSDTDSQSSRLRVVAHSASTIGTIIQGTSTQTADLLKLKRDTLDVLTVAGTGAVVMRNSANSTDAFQVQNASSQRVLGVNTTAGEVTLGTGSTLAGKLVVYNATNSNAVTLTVGATSASYTLTLPTSVGSANQCLQNSATPGILTWAACGGGASTKTIKVLAEYAGGILSGDGTSNTGTMAANHDSTARRNYYEWTTTQGTAQDYDVVATVQMPSDFVSIGAASGFKFYMYDGDGATTTAKVTWTVIDGSGTQCFSSDFNGGAANTWEQKSASSLGTCTFSANSEVTFRFKLTTTSGAGSIRIGGFEYQYSN